MDIVKSLIPLREYCRKNPWPRLTQWNHWIYTRAPIAEKCVKKIGGRYLIDINAFQSYLSCATLEEPHTTSNSRRLP